MSPVFAPAVLNTPHSFTPEAIEETPQVQVFLNHAVSPVKSVLAKYLPSEVVFAVDAIVPLVKPASVIAELREIEAWFPPALPLPISIHSNGLEVLVPSSYTILLTTAV
jgi:hypothetical protein